MIKRNIVIAFVFITTFSCTNGQQNDSPDFATLVSITQKQDFTKFHQFTTDLKYAVLDSSQDSNGSIFFFTKEVKPKGNTLACSTNSKMEITELSFITFSLSAYKESKDKIRKLGFTSQGINKGGLPGISESEDFEKDDLVIATAIREKEGEAPLYEFTFFKW